MKDVMDGWDFADVQTWTRPGARIIKSNLYARTGKKPCWWEYYTPRLNQNGHVDTLEEAVAEIEKRLQP
jgi:hypothetical protein